MQLETVAYEMNEIEFAELLADLSNPAAVDSLILESEEFLELLGI